jgi:hypothetical protein
MTFTRRRVSYSSIIHMLETPIDSETMSHKHLGLTLQKDGKWNENMVETIAKSKKKN